MYKVLKKYIERLAVASGMSNFVFFLFEIYILPEGGDEYCTEIIKCILQAVRKIRDTYLRVKKTT